MENKHYHIIIASIVFAFSVWLSVNLRHEYTVNIQIPVVIENLQAGKALKYPIPKFVNVRFKGPGWLIAGLYFLPDIKYYIDVSTINSDNFILTPKDLFDHVKIPVDVSPIDVKPETLTLAIDVYGEKRVAVKPRIVLRYHEGYGQVGFIILSPESVIIGGARSVIEEIDSWQTVYKRFEDLRTPINEQIQLEEPASHILEVLNQSVQLQVNVQPFAEKTIIGIPIIANATPAGREVIFIPPKMDIIVRGGVDLLSKLSVSDFQATIRYERLISDSLEYVKPDLTFPEEIKVIGCQPERFQYIIRKKL